MFASYPASDYIEDDTAPPCGKGSFTGVSTTFIFVFFLNSGRPSAKQQQPLQLAKASILPSPTSSCCSMLCQYEATSDSQCSMNSSSTEHATIWKPDTSQKERSEAAKKLWNQSATSESRPATRAHARHRYDSAEARSLEHREQQKPCNTCKKALRADSHSRVTTSYTSMGSTPA